MNQQEWERVESALDTVLDSPREQWRDACVRIAAGDAVLQRELESLLESIETAHPLLDGTAGSLADDVEPVVAQALAPGTQIGAYRIVDLLGRGGMGEVYRATRADGLYQQDVAIKLIRPDVNVRSRQFEAERQILARLQHPGIARLLDGGVTADGRSFMIMELVDGQPITRWCREHQSSLAQRLRLFVDVCTAVAYAHRNLIVHRDLKSSNVLVTKTGEVKLLDFGVARLLDQTPNQETRVALTPTYAAPEQLCGQPITTATDVYALGMLFFELLTGVSPWGPDELPIALLVQRILRDPIPRASECAARLSQSPVAPKAIAGDLDAIIAKALRKEPDARYPSADALRDDVERMLHSEPVSARAGARLYVARRFLRRHRLGVAASAVVLLAIVGGALVAWWQAERALAEARRARAVQDFTLSLFKASDPNEVRDHDPTVSELLASGAEQLDTKLQSQPLALAELHTDLGDIYGDISDYGKAQAQLERALALYQSLGAERTAGGIQALYLHGRVLGEVNDFARSKAELERTLQYADAAFGPRNRWALPARQKLSYAMEGLGDEAGAVKVLQEGLALPVGEDIASDRLNRMRLRVRLASAEAELGDFRAARAVFASVIADEPSVPELGFEDRMTTRIELSRTEWRDSDYPAALTQIQEVIPLLDSKIGPTSDRTIRARGVLTNVLASMGRFDEACEVARINLANRLARPAHEDELIAIGRYTLADMLRRAMRFEEARPVIAEVVEYYDTADPEHSADGEYARAMQGQILIGSGNVRDGAALIEQARQNWEPLPGYAGSSDEASTLEKLAWARRLLGDWTQAQALFAKSCAVMQASGLGTGLPGKRCTVELAWARAWLDPQNATLAAALAQAADQYRNALPEEHVGRDDVALMLLELDRHRGREDPARRQAVAAHWQMLMHQPPPATTLFLH